MWRRLSPLVAARRSVRLWDPAERAFERTGLSSLPRRVPAVPAAVPIFDRRRHTTLLALDFDAKKLGAAAVDADVARARQWLTECGARIVEDRSTSGGAHLLVPLYVGTPHRIRHVTPVLRLLANRLPTLDLSPMSNDRTGCITPPGSACREGGHRRLVGNLDDAVDALTVRSQQGLVARLLALLGDLTPPAHTRRASTTSAAAQIGADAAAIANAGTDRMCVSKPPLPGTLPLPPVVAAFAAHGAHDTRWKSPSEARQSVLAQAAMRGLSLADVQHRIHDGSWAGLAAAYDRYAQQQRVAALGRDWTKACRYVVAIAGEVRSSGHRYWNTGGLLEGAAFEQHRAWLAQAVRWVDVSWPRSAKRWTALAVLQAVAYMAAIGGENVNGTLVVAVGGRSLSTEAAMMPETTLWETLAELRDRPGSPILRTRRGAGLLPDAYALVTPRDDHGDPIAASAGEAAAARIEPVHAAWRTLGLHTRRLYEAIVHGGATRPDEAFAAARIGRTAGYDALAVLSTAGVVEHRRNALRAGTVSLDDYATKRRLHEIRTDRIERHRLERALWRNWLELRFAPPPPDDAHSTGDNLDLPVYDAAHASIDEASWADLLAAADTIASDPPNQEPGWTAADNPAAGQEDKAWWSHIGAEATPPPPEHAAAVAIVTTVLGAEVVPT